MLQLSEIGKKFKKKLNSWIKYFQEVALFFSSNCSGLFIYEIDIHLALFNPKGTYTTYSPVVYKRVTANWKKYFDLWGTQFLKNINLRVFPVKYF